MFEIPSICEALPFTGVWSFDVTGLLTPPMTGFHSDSRLGDRIALIHRSVSCEVAFSYYNADGFVAYIDLFTFYEAMNSIRLYKLKNAHASVL